MLPRAASDVHISWVARGADASFFLATASSWRRPAKPVASAAVLPGWQVPGHGPNTPLEPKARRRGFRVAGAGAVSVRFQRCFSASGQGRRRAVAVPG